GFAALNSGYRKIHTLLEWAKGGTATLIKPDASGRLATVRTRALGRSRPERQACCRIANRCYRFGQSLTAKGRATTGVGEATGRIMSEVMRPSRFDARAQPPPRIIYVVSEDWYFLSHCLTMARAARSAGFEIHVVTNVTEEAEIIRAEDFTVH